MHSPTDQAIKLTETTGCSTGHPVWLPDGLGIAYESNCQDGNWEIYRASLTYSVIGAAKIIAQPISSQQVVRLTTNVGDDHWPRVSPDGSQVAVFANRDGTQEIYTMNIDGGNQTRLTNSGSRDEGPVWSPDGTKIAFNSNRDGDHEIFVMNADGSGLTQLTNNSVDDGFAVWGP